MTKNYLIVLLFCIILLPSQGQTLINTSFESADNYVLGSIHNQNKWTVTSGTGSVVNTAEYVSEGSQAVKLTASATALQVDRIDFSSNSTALAGDVYIDFRIKQRSIPTTNFAITGYDLGANTHRSFMIEFLSTGKIKIYDGSSGWATTPAYTSDSWTRISVKIDNNAAKYQIAINGVVYDKLFAFREIKNSATSFDYHSIRFSMSSGTCDAAIDNLYIGSTPVSGISFQASSTDRTISVTQPAFGTISLTPAKNTYQLNDQVTAGIAVPEHYIFSGWTGDLSGTENPKTFTVTGNMAFGANVIIDATNPPAQSTISLVQPTGATISLTPQQTTYYNGTSVKAQLTVQSGYQFNGWTGSLSGTTNPVTFIVNSNMNIGANISEIQVNPTKRIVSTVIQFKEAMSAMNPGDTVLVLDGTYNIGGLKITRGGSALKPIIIKSANLHGAKITGSTYFYTSNQSYVTYEGFDFSVEPGSTIFKMEGCNNVRITRNRFSMATSSDSTQTSKWITIGDLWDNEICNSHHNRIDHNLFDGKHDSGAWLVIDGSHGTVPAISQHDRIDHNIFRNNTPRLVNEKETVRIGVSDLCKLDAYTVVESNLFEDCDGDPEIVSVKSCKDTVRNNTFRRCAGTVCLRQGNNSVVEGNYFFGEGKTTTYAGSSIGCGGVRVYGLNHKITNNYFEGLTGSKWDATCTLTNGDVTNTSSSNSSHFLPENILFAYNTLINNKSDFEIGFDNSGAYGLAPKNNIIANNIVINNVNPIIKSFSNTSLAGVSFQNNIMYPTGTSTLGLTGVTDLQIKNADPLLIKTSCRAYNQNCNYTTPFETYKLSSSSPAINTSTGNLQTDAEGQPVVGVRDIGADEFNADAVITNGPLNEQQVGPNAPEVFTYEINTSTKITLLPVNDFSISPNPFKGSTRISMPANTDEIFTIQLYNATGQQIEFTKIANDPLFIDIATSYKGLIICIVTNKDLKYSFKLISE